MCGGVCVEVYVNVYVRISKGCEGERKASKDDKDVGQRAKGCRRVEVEGEGGRKEGRKKERKKERSKIKEERGKRKEERGEEKWKTIKTSVNELWMDGWSLGSLGHLGKRD
jgi:hypothetical protein